MFFAILSKLCSKYLPKQSPLFVNIPPGVMEESAAPQTTTTQSIEGTEFKCTACIRIQNCCTPFSTDSNEMETGIAEEDYQALTDKEEKDLERLLSQSDNALGNAEKFMEQLSKELSLLDGVKCDFHYRVF